MYAHSRGKGLILVRYILREHIAPFIAALSVITLLFVVDFMVTLLDNVMNKGLPWKIVLEIFVLNLAWMTALAVPMAVLAATLMAFGRFSADHEITALKAAGISPLRLMRPVILVALLLFELLVVFNNWVLPEANHRSAALMASISRLKPHAFIDAGRLLTQFPGVQIWIDEIDPATGTLRGIEIFENENGEAPKIIVADSARILPREGSADYILRLHHGENHLLDRDDPAAFYRIRFIIQEIVIHNPDQQFERKERNHRSDREMPVEQMLDVVQEAGETYTTVLEKNARTVWTDLDALLEVLPSDTLIPESEKGFRDLPTHVEKHRAAVRKVLISERSRLRTLGRVADQLEQEKKRIAQYWVEIHKKFSIPVACVVFVLVGAPLGIMARRGGIGTGVVYSLFFYILYWVGLIGGENLADRLLVDPIPAMWVPNMLIGLFGVFITWRMGRDNYSGNSFWTILLIKIRSLRKAK